MNNKKRYTRNPCYSLVKWQFAPKWAGYHAIDKDLKGFWYEEIPDELDEEWQDSTGHRVLESTKYLLELPTSDDDWDWTRTYEIRPACDYCERGKDNYGISGDPGGGGCYDGIDTQIRGDRMIMNARNEYEDIEINYCPMCGRLLKEFK